MDTFVVPPMFGHGLVRQEVMLAGAKELSNDIINGVLSGDGWCGSSGWFRYKIESQVITSVRLALRADP